MIVIYRIISPSGRVYIGQSKNYKKRIAAYKNMGSSVKNQRLLYASFLKYGCENHFFKILHELPIDVGQEVVDVYEILYIAQHKSNVIKFPEYKGLNLCSGGAAGTKGTKHTAEQNKAKSLWMKGKKNGQGTKHTDEMRKTISDRAKGNKYSLGKIPYNKGKKGIYKHTDEWKKDARKRMTGTKATEETLIKISGINSHRSKPVLNTKSGAMFISAVEAAKNANMNVNTLRGMLTGLRKNTSSFIYKPAEA